MFANIIYNYTIIFVYTLVWLTAAYLYPDFSVLSIRRYEEDMYWRRMEEEQLYWGEQRRRMAPPPLMGRPNMPVPPLLVSKRIDRNQGHSLWVSDRTFQTDQNLF